MNNEEEINIVEKIRSLECDIVDSKCQIKSYQDKISTYRSDLNANRRNYDNKIIDYIETSIRTLNDTIRYLEMRIGLANEEIERCISSFTFTLKQD